MKKIQIYSLLIISIIVTIFLVPQAFASCEYNGSDFIGSIENCLSDTELVQPGDGKVEGGIKNLFVSWTNAIATALSLLAIGAIVLGGLMMTLSGGEDEKIKKGKDIVKWSLIGFLAAISAGAVVRLLVEVIFAIAS